MVFSVNYNVHISPKYFLKKHIVAASFVKSPIRRSTLFPLKNGNRGLLKHHCPAFYLHYILPYSLLKATTGSFLAALLEGMIPDTRVSITLIKTSITAATGGKNAVRL